MFSKIRRSTNNNKINRYDIYDRTDTVRNNNNNNNNKSQPLGTSSRGNYVFGIISLFHSLQSKEAVNRISLFRLILNSNKENRPRI